MHRMAEYFADEIRYTVDDPCKIFYRYCARFSCDINQEQTQTIGSFSCLFADLIQEQTASLRLPEFQKQLLFDFADGLGVTDMEGQLNHCNHYGKLFLQQVDAATVEYNEKGKLFRSLLWLSAASFVVLIG